MWTFWNMFPFLGKRYYFRYGNFKILQKKKKKEIVIVIIIKGGTIASKFSRNFSITQYHRNFFPLRYHSNFSYIKCIATMLDQCNTRHRRLSIDRKKSRISNFHFSRIVFVPDFRGRPRRHRHEKFLEHVDASSPWPDCITIPLCFAAVYHSGGSHSRAPWKRERLEILRRRGYYESERWREDAWHVSRIPENHATEKQGTTPSAFSSFSFIRLPYPPRSRVKQVHLIRELRFVTGFTFLDTNIEIDVLCDANHRRRYDISLYDIEGKNVKRKYNNETRWSGCRG